MDKISEVTVSINGKVTSSPELVARYKGTKILSVDIENKRRSGGVDTFQLHFSNTLGVVIDEGMYVEVKGDIRTINDKESERVIYPFIMAHSIAILDSEPEEYHNDVEIVDAELVGFDGVRASYTDDNKQLATYRVCVRRKHGRNSYFRVTTWGRDAVFLGNVYKTVQYLHLKCRLQSHINPKNNRSRFGLVTYYLEIPESERQGRRAEMLDAESVGNEVPAEAEGVETAPDTEPVGAEASAEAFAEAEGGESEHAEEPVDIETSVEAFEAAEAEEDKETISED